MKKIIIILLGLVFAFIVSEIIVYKIVGYPKRTDSVKYVFLPDFKGFENLKFKEPYSKFWTVEGGNKVYSYNNLRITGRDVYPDDKSTLIFVLGDSYVEAASVPADSTGVTIFQNELNTIDTNLKAINIGYPNSDPYTLWFRTMFFEKTYKADYVILLLTHLDLLDQNMQRHPDTLNFAVPENFGEVIPQSKSDKFFDIFRKKSAVFNLLSTSMSVAGSKKDVSDGISDEYVKDLNRSMKKLRDCLLRYQEKFGDKFIVVSLEVNDEKSKVMSDVCDSMKINYADRKLLIPENQWGKGSHLNYKGNREFGKFLFEIFMRYYKKDKLK
ncbi:MAG: hypothetical protein PHN88_00375 [Ignavibacteria bacterium]|nr:hypothetical protein [Ignavibacteria bacterium]